MSSFPGDQIVSEAAQPGILATQTATPINTVTLGGEQYFPGGIILNGASCRDIPNNPYSYQLRAGNLLGLIAGTNTFGTSIIGLTTANMAANATTMVSSLAIGNEIIRRIGTAGNLVLIGPPAANGVVAVTPVQFTGVNTSNGNVTIVATGTAAVNEVHTLTETGTLTGGSFALIWQNGLIGGTTAPITVATAAAIQAALRALPGVGSNITVTGSTDGPYTITFSGGLGGAPQPLIIADLSLTTGITAMVDVVATPGQPGMGVAAVQTVTMDAAATGGTFTLEFNGVASGTIAYSGTNATLLSNIQTALRALGGPLAAATVGGAAAATTFTVTFTNAPGPQPLLIADIGLYQSGSAAPMPGVTIVTTTAGVAGGVPALLAGSIIAADDGSAYPITFVGNGYPISVFNVWLQTNVNVQLGKACIGGLVRAPNFVNYPSDPSLQLWVQNQLSTANGGKFAFESVWRP